MLISPGFFFKEANFSHSVRVKEALIDISREKKLTLRVKTILINVLLNENVWRHAGK